jgi:hypothetical protein
MADQQGASTRDAFAARARHATRRAPFARSRRLEDDADDPFPPRSTGSLEARDAETRDAGAAATTVRARPARIADGLDLSRLNIARASRARAASTADATRDDRAIGPRRVARAIPTPPRARSRDRAAPRTRRPSSACGHPKSIRYHFPHARPSTV